MRAFALSIALIALPSIVSAQRPSAPVVEQQLGSIRELLLSARFDDAADAARALLARTDLRAAERNTALEVLATAQIAMRARSDAQQTLALLYSRDPGHRLTDSDASPPVISAFARAREAHPEPVPVRLEHQPPRLTRREPPFIRVRIGDGADAVAEVRLVYQIGGEGTARVVMTHRDDGSYSARIPVVGDASQATDVAYHIVALAPSLAPLATRGSEAEPMQLRIPAEGESVSRASQGELPPVLQGAGDATPEDGDAGGGGGSVATEWWFWTIIVALVAGGVTTGVVLGTMEAPTEGSLGVARLMQLEW